MPGSPTDAPPLATHPVAVVQPDYLWFADLALGGMARIVEDLGDELANRRPSFPDSNTPYAILTHCLGVVEYWAGATVAGRSIERDRPAEFTASGPVAPLLERAAAAQQRLSDDLHGLDTWSEPQSVRRSPDDPVPYAETKGAVLLHILEEVFQHLGQMEITRDVLRAQP
ncbi:MAG TPA: DinB family protein [Acidimicrobiales bacterium]|nr:DinB family protein [Acidimicrobiales bacterium]